MLIQIKFYIVIHLIVPKKALLNYFLTIFSKIIQVNLKNFHTIVIFYLIQEHRYYCSKLELKYLDSSNGWIFILEFAWKNLIGVASEGILLSHRVLKSLNSIVRIHLRMMFASTVISYYSLINTRDETDITIFSNELSSLVQHILNHNVLIIGKDMNAHIDKDKNWFGLVWFYGISTAIGYLMPNPVYAYIRYIWFVNIRQKS